MAKRRSDESERPAPRQGMPAAQETTAAVPGPIVDHPADLVDSRPGRHRLMRELQVFEAALAEVARRLQSAYRALDTPLRDVPPRARLFGAMGYLGDAEDAVRGMGSLLANLILRIDDETFDEPAAVDHVEA